jgi:hypothetical protein
MRKYNIKSKKESHVPYITKLGKINWICDNSRINCHLRHIVKGKRRGGIEVTQRQGRRRKQLLDDLKKTGGYCKLKEKAVDLTL